MKRYVVHHIVHVEGTRLQQVEIMANDAAHAIEQCENHYPTATAVFAELAEDDGDTSSSLDSKASPES